MSMFVGAENKKTHLGANGNCERLVEINKLATGRIGNISSFGRIPVECKVIDKCEDCPIPPLVKATTFASAFMAAIGR